MNDKKCPNGFKQIRTDCMKCDFCVYTECPAEIAVTDINGIASHWIALTGDETYNKKKIKLWQKICTKKINKAYKSYSDKK